MDITVGKKVIVHGGGGLVRTGKVVSISDSPDGLEFDVDFGDAIETYTFEDGIEAVHSEDIDHDDEPWDGFLDDVEADADVLRSAGWGTDEDYAPGASEII